jgi:hypothetical protein
VIDSIPIDRSSLSLTSRAMTVPHLPGNVPAVPPMAMWVANSAGCALPSKLAATMLVGPRKPFELGGEMLHCPVEIHCELQADVGDDCAAVWMSLIRELWWPPPKKGSSWPSSLFHKNITCQGLRLIGIRTESLRELRSCAIIFFSDSALV